MLTKQCKRCYSQNRRACKPIQVGNRTLLSYCNTSSLIIIFTLYCSCILLDSGVDARKSLKRVCRDIGSGRLTSKKKSSSEFSIKKKLCFLLLNLQIKSQVVGIGRYTIGCSNRFIIRT